MVAGEQHVGAFERECHVVGGMPRRRHRFEREAVALEYIAVGERDVGDKFPVAAFEPRRFANMQRPRRAMRPFAVGFCASGRLDARRRRRMVAMGVGDEDMRHRLPSHRIEERGDMRLIERPRIDEGDLAAADDVADRPLERHRPRIVAHDAPQTGAHLLDEAGPQVEIFVEGDRGHARQARNAFQAARRALMRLASPGLRFRHANFRS